MAHRGSNAGGMVASLARLVAVGVLAAAGASAGTDPPPLPGDVAEAIRGHTDAIRKLKAAGDYGSAIVEARLVYELRAQHQPEPWWQRVAARVTVEDLESMAALPEDARARLAATEQLLGEARRLSEDGRYSAALEVMERQLAARLDILPPNHTDVARSLVNTALDLHRLGRFDAAEERYLRALTIFRARLPGDSPATAQTLHNLAWLRLLRGDHASAEPVYLEALEMRRRLFAAGDPAILETVNSYAALLFESDRLEECEPLYREALEARRSMHPAGHADLAKSMKNMGEVLAARGGRALAESDGDAAAALFDEAERFFNGALEMRRGLLQPEHPDLAWTLESLAHLAMRRGDASRAEALLSDALAIARAGLGEENGQVGQLMAALGRAQAAAGDVDAARLSFEAALAIAEKVRASVLGDERTRATYAGRLGVHGTAAALAALCMDAGDLDAALNAIERGRGRALLDLLARSEVDLVSEIARTQGEEAAASLRAAIDAVEGAREEQARTEALLAAAHRDRRQAEAGDAERIRSLESQIETRRAAVDQARRGAADAESIVNGLMREAWPQANPLDARAIRAGLAPGERLLVYSWSETRVAVLVIPPEGEDGPAAITLARGPTEVARLAEVVRAMRRSVAARGSSDETRRASIDAGALLLPASLAAPLAKAQRIVIIPDGPLHGIPFEALPVDSPRGMLIDSPAEIVYAGSATMAARHAALNELVEPVAITVTAVGNPAFDRESPDPAGSGPSGTATRGGRDPSLAQVNALDSIRLFGGRLAPLPGTEAEARAIARLVAAPSGAPSSGSIPRAELLLGCDATLARLEAILDCRYLHLATHGLTGSAERPYDASLAMAQPAVPSADDIGFLTLERMIERWRGRLAGCELVVLSACDTQRGVERGDSVMALPWGFFYAGADAVIASLWTVDDAATMLLMTRLYENLLGAFDHARRSGPRQYEARQRMTRADALREARLWLRGLDAAGADEALRLAGGAGGESGQWPLATSERGVTRPGAASPPKAPAQPYESPYFWAAFILMGDPG